MADRMTGLLLRLLSSKTPQEFRVILEEIGDRAEVGLDEDFGSPAFSWHAFGDNPSNTSSAGIGTKPGRSLTERLTNATDALLEERALSGVSLPRSPRDAAQQWFGRPMSGPDSGLFEWNYSANDYDRRIAVVLTSSGNPTSPTVDVIDDGIGITAAHFPDTILSLQKGNKINKWFVIGSFGQGGASTLPFAEYVLIASRHRDDPTKVAFTVIRVLNLSEHFKEDAYAYLAIRDATGAPTVPVSDFGADPLILYPAAGLHRAPALKKGTLVRHVAYQLGGLEKTLSASPGNLYHYLHYSMFDPLLPFRVMDLRKTDGEKDELVSGSRNRLMKLVAKKDDGDEGRTELKHYRPMEYFVSHASTDPSIGIEYWVVFNYRKSNDPSKGDLVLRGNSNELYVQAGHPIVGTLNGQNQGELTAQLLRELNLGMVARHIVVHVDASKANSRVRRELFSSSREGFKDGDVLSWLVGTLKTMLGEDEQLRAIERELTERISNQSAQETSEEVRKHVTRLLIESGFKLKESGTTVTRGDGEKQAVPRERKGSRYKKAHPLPTLAFPNVTRFEIVWPKPLMEIHLQDSESVIIETDADAEFDRKQRVAIRCEPAFLEVAGKAPLHGGRMRWRLRPSSSTQVGQRGRIVVTLTLQDGTQLVDQTEFEVKAAIEERTKKIKGEIPPFEIRAINPEDHQADWATAWPALSDETDAAKQAAVAYSPVEAGGKTIVYYSTIFGPFKEETDRLKNAPVGQGEMFKTNYEIWIAYHAILQKNEPREKAFSEPEAMDRHQEQERALVARMQIKQALKTAELMRALQKAKNE